MSSPSDGSRLRRALPASPSQHAGFAYESQALAHLQSSGLVLVERNAASKLGELDLVMRDGDTLVFVEVRSRSSMRFGGAAASVGPDKQRRLRRAAQQYLNARFGTRRWPPCRFDVVAFDAGRLHWIADAF